jgi:hypothetical protein
MQIRDNAKQRTAATPARHTDRSKMLLESALLAISGIVLYLLLKPAATAASGAATVIPLPEREGSTLRSPTNLRAPRLLPPTAVLQLL